MQSAVRNVLTHAETRDGRERSGFADVAATTANDNDHLGFPVGRFRHSRNMGVLTSERGLKLGEDHWLAGVGETHFVGVRAVVETNSEHLAGVIDDHA